MRKMFSAKRLGFRPNNVMLYPERNGFYEDVTMPKGLGVCGWCGAVYSLKAWHHPEVVRKKMATNFQSVWLGRCKACAMIANGRYEGEVIITDIPLEMATELSGFIRSFATRAYARDCQHRLIALHKESDSTWRVTFTENQLANGLARRIQNTFRGALPKISFSCEPGGVKSVRILFHPIPEQKVVEETRSHIIPLTRVHDELATPA